jgi:hypothetical protein
MSIAAKTNRLVQLRLYFKTEIHCDFVLSKYCALHEYRAAKEDKLNHKQRCKATGSRLRARLQWTRAGGALQHPSHGQTFVTGATSADAMDSEGVMGWARGREQVWNGKLVSKRSSVSKGPFDMRP